MNEPAWVKSYPPPPPAGDVVTCFFLNDWPALRVFLSLAHLGYSHIHSYIVCPTPSPDAEKVGKQPFSF